MSLKPTDPFKIQIRKLKTKKPKQKLKKIRVRKSFKNPTSAENLP